MAAFEKLVRLLEKELNQQDKLLEILTRERAAIVKMNQEEVEKVAVEKQKVLEVSQTLEDERGKVMASIVSDEEDAKSATFKTIVAQCPKPDVKVQLKTVGAELKQVAENVKELNDHNGLLLKQSLGLIASTLSIFRSAPVSELPAYSRSGSVEDGDANSVGARRGTSRQA